MQSAIHTTPTCPCCSSLHRPRAALLSTSCVSPTRCEWDPGDTCGAWQGNNRRVVNFQASEARSLCRLPTQNILAERANRSVLTQTGALGEAQRLQAWGTWGDKHPSSMPPSPAVDHRELSPPTPMLQASSCHSTSQWLVFVSCTGLALLCAHCPVSGLPPPHFYHKSYAGEQIWSTDPPMSSLLGAYPIKHMSIM